MLDILYELNTCHRSLSELDSLRLSGEAGEKIRQVTERATLFRITSNAMINVSCLKTLEVKKRRPLVFSRIWESILTE